MRKTILSLLLLAPMVVTAQSLGQHGQSVETLVPQGWEHSEAVGDLNKDGLEDLVVIATPNFRDKVLTRNDGYEINMNPPQLAIYFGQAGGGFTLFKKYEELIQARDEYCIVETSLQVTERGVLHLGVSTFHTAGTADTGGPTYVFRYQNGDFYLIGKEQFGFSRMSGEAEEVSENYLTWKRQVKTFNMFKDKTGKERETWTKLRRRPLQRLGEFEL